MKNTKIDLRAIEAEENMLLDFQFLLQDVINAKGITRTELAKRAGISKARLSQILSAEANPNIKTFARLFHALDAKVRLECSAAQRGILVPSEEYQWRFEKARLPELNKPKAKRRSEWYGAANDNYFELDTSVSRLVA